MSAIGTVRTWMQEVLTSSVPVLLSPLNGPAPARPYVTITLISDVGSCNPLIDRTLVPEVVGPPIVPAYVSYAAEIDSEISVSVQAFADNGDDLLNKLKAFAKLPQYTGPSLVDCGAIRDLTFLDDETFKRRFQCDYTFAVSYTTSATDTPISTVTMSGTAGTIDASVSYETEV